MEIKKMYVIIFVSSLLISVSVNIVLVYINEGYKELLTDSVEANKESWEAMTEAMDVMNNTKEYILSQKESIDNLTQMNIAYQMYILSGNESWLPKPDALLLP